MRSFPLSIGTRRKPPFLRLTRLRPQLRHSNAVFGQAATGLIEGRDIASHGAHRSAMGPAGHGQEPIHVLESVEETSSTHLSQCYFGERNPRHLPSAPRRDGAG